MGNSKLPPIVWLRVTDFIHAWLQHELSGELIVKDQRVVCVQHLEGAREVFRMATVNDIKEKNPAATSLSAVKRNCIAEGIDLDEETVTDQCRVLKEDLRMFVPIECPKVCMTLSGVLRPWTLEITFGHAAIAEESFLGRRGGIQPTVCQEDERGVLSADRHDRGLLRGEGDSRRVRCRYTPRVAAQGEAWRQQRPYDSKERTGKREHSESLNFKLYDMLISAYPFL